MPPRLFPYAFLLSFGFISTFAIQDLRYYQDHLLPNLSPEEEIALKQFERLIKSSGQNARYGSLPIPHLADFASKEEQRREFERQTLNALAEESNIIHSLPKRRQKHVPNYPPPQARPNAFEENPVLRKFPARNPSGFYSYLHPYPSDIGPLTNDARPQHQDMEYPTVGYRSHHEVIPQQGMKEEPILDFGGKYRSPDQQIHQHYTGGVIANDDEQPGEEFTFSFDNDRVKDVQGFARNPSQPGYYDHEDPVSEQTAVDLEEDDRTEEILAKDEEDEVFEISKLVDRRADNQSPSVMEVEHKISNDIYFVAVVAGCSAAAMFILVLISLTWCRLQRGAKAAADVEYPAYGVTGPNKDTSPSGDRRLAQSAQMYHYQHQKQQIIAMESRTATARDPGSVSEAESDEENEEGDYTVYECPGLAPTGEMEVKNPLFHDDPTPATPAGQGQNKRSSEDHM